MNHVRRFLAFSLFALAVTATASRAQSAIGFKVVVHPSNPTTELSRAEISRLFLKKDTLWDHAGTVAPVDLVPNNRTRQRFSKAIHGREVRRVQSYWLRLIFSGRAAPPPELDQERQVLEFVANDRQAIGYVSSTTTVGKDVKVVKVID